MTMNLRRGALLAGITGSLIAPCWAAYAADHLPSWNEGPAKQSIVRFVDRVTKQGGPDFVPVAERIAAFDNDGSLWAEQPMYFQLAFALDRVKALAPHLKKAAPVVATAKGIERGTHKFMT